MERRNIFEELKLAIMRGVFKPRERLVERELAERFEASRTPIREAIRKLESIGMVRIIPNQGAKVADFSPGNSIRSAGPVQEKWSASWKKWGSK